MATRPRSTESATSAGTREVLLDVGERMFAERGVHGVSLREIGIAAEQRNNGVTQYHFGDKAGLIRAIFERRATIVNERRLELLAARERAGRSDLHSLITAYVLPLVEQVAAGTSYVPFLSRLQAEHQRDAFLEDIDTSVNTAYLRIRNDLRRHHLSHLSTERFAIRWRISVNLAIDALADYQDLARATRPPSIETFRAELIQAITAVLAA